MNLHDHMQRAVDGAEPDLDRLSRVARAQGTRLRRRRQGVTALGAMAAVSVLAVGVGLSAGGQPGGQRAADPAGGPAASPGATSDLSRTAPLTGRGATAALAHVVASLEDGTASGFRGQGTPAHHESYSELQWDDGGGGVSVIGLNVQPGMRHETSCRSVVAWCSVRKDENGTLTTYEEHTPVAEGVGIRRVAELVRADGVRVVVSSSNGHDLPRSQWDLTRPQPALTTEQLVRIVRQPWWGAELPARFDEQGEALEGYVDFESAVGGKES